MRNGRPQPMSERQHAADQRPRRIIRDLRKYQRERDRALRIRLPSRRLLGQFGVLFLELIRGKRLGLR